MVAQERSCTSCGEVCFPASLSVFSRGTKRSHDFQREKQQTGARILVKAAEAWLALGGGRVRDVTHWCRRAPGTAFHFASTPTSVELPEKIEVARPRACRACADNIIVGDFASTKLFRVPGSTAKVILCPTSEAKVRGERPASSRQASPVEPAFIPNPNEPRADEPFVLPPGVNLAQFYADDVGPDEPEPEVFDPDAPPFWAAQSMREHARRTWRERDVARRWRVTRARLAAIESRRITHAPRRATRARPRAPQRRRITSGSAARGSPEPAPASGSANVAQQERVCRDNSEEDPLISVRPA